MFNLKEKLQNVFQDSTLTIRLIKELEFDKKLSELKKNILNDASLNEIREVYIAEETKAKTKLRELKQESADAQLQDENHHNTSDSLGIGLDQIILIIIVTSTFTTIINKILPRLFKSEKTLSEIEKSYKKARHDIEQLKKQLHATEERLSSYSEQLKSIEFATKEIESFLDQDDQSEEARQQVNNYIISISKLIDDLKQLED